MIGPSVPVAALVSLTSLTAEPVVPKTKDSFPFASAINPPSANFGAVKVLLVNVVVELAVTVPSRLTSIRSVPLM